MRPANGRAASSLGDTLYRPPAHPVNGRVLSGSVSTGPRATPCAEAAPAALLMLTRDGPCVPTPSLQPHKDETR